MEYLLRAAAGYLRSRKEFVQAFLTHVGFCSRCFVLSVRQRLWRAKMTFTSSLTCSVMWAVLSDCLTGKLGDNSSLVRESN